MGDDYPSCLPYVAFSTQPGSEGSEAKFCDGVKSSQIRINYWCIGIGVIGEPIRITSCDELSRGTNLLVY
jgi:hypothetical protein